ncbi:MAG: hypothetical protein US61_C0042G0008 [Parcubacteria group bacterium GW2011_GWE2_37_8]|nr:MAG: hypothetical protein US61_C0042G0008 [Parcubacteria group bacterium GW2011_GWE2_37_8]
MPRPRKLEQIIITGDIKIKKSEFQTGFRGTVDAWGQIKTVGKEYDNCEFEIYVKNRKEEPHKTKSTETYE